MKKLLLMALIFMSSLNNFIAHAQSKTITLSGKVISFEESLALEGVSISVKGTSKSTGTQADGTFSIAVAPDDKILIFSFTEYQTQEIAISSNTDYNVVLRRANTDNATLPQQSRLTVIENNTTQICFAPVTESASNNVEQ